MCVYIYIKCPGIFSFFFNSLQVRAVSITSTDRKRKKKKKKNFFWKKKVFLSFFSLLFFLLPFFLRNDQSEGLRYTPQVERPDEFSCVRTTGPRACARAPLSPYRNYSWDLTKFKHFPKWTLLLTTVSVSCAWLDTSRIIIEPHAGFLPSPGNTPLPGFFFPRMLL